MSVHQAQPIAHHPLTAPLAPLLRTTPSTITSHQPFHRQLTPPPPPPSVATTTATTTTTTVTLQAPRPDIERATNEYVETPFRSPATTVPTHLQQQHHHPHHNQQQHQPHQQQQQHQHLHHQQQQQHHATADKSTVVGPPVHRLERPSRLPLVAITSHQHHQPHQGLRHHLPIAVTKQPVAFTKDHPSVVSGASGGTLGTVGGDACSNSGNIICSECGRCRCEPCRTPRALPSRWVCDNACLCSADTIIDYASCLCCVKALYYHCSDTDAGATCADDPCSCGPHRRVARWACLGALTTLLPCLLCYWPLRACQRAVEAAYARHSRAGCRCRPHQATPEKRLLDSSPEF